MQGGVRAYMTPLSLVIVIIEGQIKKKKKLRKYIFLIYGSKKSFLTIFCASPVTAQIGLLIFINKSMLKITKIVNETKNGCKIC